MRRVRTALHDIGIQRALCQECKIIKLAGLLIEYVDELVADDFPFFSGSSTPFSLDMKRS